MISTLKINPHSAEAQMNLPFAQKKLARQKRLEAKNQKKDVLINAEIQLKSIIKRSGRIYLGELKRILNLDDEIFNQKIVEWSEKFKLTIRDEILEF